MFLRFLHPLALLLLLGLPWVYLLTRRSYAELGRFRGTTVLVLRLVILLLLILALAGVQRVRRTSKLSVIFAADLSASIPESYRELAVSYINRAAAEMKPDDTAGLVVFGAGTSVEASPRGKLRIDRIRSLVSPEYTDIASALRLALASFPEDAQRRVVLISDGNENRGDALKLKLCAERLYVRCGSVVHRLDIRAKREE